MNIYTFFSKSKNEVIVIVEENIKEAIKAMNAHYISRTEKDDYVIGSSIKAIKGYHCSTTII